MWTPVDDGDVGGGDCGDCDHGKKVEGAGIAGVSPERGRYLKKYLKS